MMVGMLLFSFLLSNMKVSDLTSAAFQNFAAGLILAAGKILYNSNNNNNNNNSSHIF